MALFLSVVGPVISNSIQVHYVFYLKDARSMKRYVNRDCMQTFTLGHEGIYGTNYGTNYFILLERLLDPVEHFLHLDGSLYVVVEICEVSFIK
jgi:hypothetical protein